MKKIGGMQKEQRMETETRAKGQERYKETKGCSARAKSALAASTHLQMCACKLLLLKGLQSAAPSREGLQKNHAP
jgi:hypothetical protein